MKSYVDPSAPPTQKIRLYEFTQSVNKTSETGLENWKKCTDKITTTFNSSPFGQRSGQTMCVDDFARWLKGMNGDHASGVKKEFVLVGQWKEDVKFRDIGKAELISQQAAGVVEKLVEANIQKIEEVGGPEAWEALSRVDQLARDVAMMSDVIRALGRDGYNKLSETEKRGLDLFIWAGCCMHKELNSIKGGNTALKLY